MKPEPELPVIAFFKDDPIIYGISTKESLHKCDQDFLDNYKGSTMIDSKGKLYVVANAKKTGWGTRLWGYHPLFKGRSIKIEFYYKEERKIDYSEFSMMLIDKLKVKTDPGWYPNSKKKIIKELEVTNDFKRIIELFINEK